VGIFAALTGMRKFCFLLFTVICSIHSNCQDTLPKFTIVGKEKTVIISWKNNYTKPLASISIQRSYDSLRNYSTIGTVLNPQNLENGYADFNPPYNKMYYRIFIAFENGTYSFSVPAKPIAVIEPEVEPEPIKNENPAQSTDSIFAPPLVKRQVWQAEPMEDQDIKNPGMPSLKIPKENEVSYPSKRVYTSKDQNIIIHIPDAIIKHYTIRFFDDSGKEIFVLKKLREDYLILEKMYFRKSGWFTFEISENEKIIEKNKLFIPKDSPKSLR